MGSGWPYLPHVLDDRIPKLRALQLLHRGIPLGLHQPLEVVRHRLGPDRAVHALDDQVGGLGPAHVAQHHLAREDHRAGVHLVEVRVLRRRPVRTSNFINKPGG